MAVLPILQYPDPRLALPGRLVEKVDTDINKIVDDMFQTHYAQENCAALAATQLGISLRITVIDFSEEKNEPLCLINPEIIEKSTTTTNTKEGCMSIRGVSKKVARAEKIKVRALDRQGEILEFEADGFMAKCIQHEIDHLDGVLFIDHLSKLQKMMVCKKFKKY